MDDCEYCKIDPKTHEGKAHGDLWLKKSFFGWTLFAPVGESEVFYCPWCGRDLSEEK